MLRSFLILLVLIILTPLAFIALVIAQLFRVRSRPGGIYERVGKLWVGTINRLAGVRIVLHNRERMDTGETRIFVSNHVSWFDVFTLAEVLPHYTFVAKSELRKIPVFGGAASAWGVIWIERENRKMAFASYRSAGEKIKAGRSVVVCPEGTRGYDYPLRRFKKGPFVLAIASGVPIVPTLVYGAIAVQPKGKFWVRPGRIDIHFLEPIPTAGLSYEDRDDLASRVRASIAAELEARYGIASPSDDTVKQEA
jgi:1-acyl-sn-glycerol-3-phosphate acyltransferase